MILGGMVLHTWASIAKSKRATMMVVTIGSTFAFSCIEFHTKGNSLVIVEAPRAPVVALLKGGAFGFFFSSSFAMSTLEMPFAFSFAFGITRRRKWFWDSWSWL